MPPAIHAASLSSGSSFTVEFLEASEAAQPLPASASRTNAFISGEWDQSASASAFLVRAPPPGHPNLIRP